MLSPKGIDLADDCLVEVLERVYLCAQRIQWSGSVSVLCFYTKTLIAVSNYGVRRDRSLNRLEITILTLDISASAVHISLTISELH